jgi:hypothetical protein
MADQIVVVEHLAHNPKSSIRSALGVLFKHWDDQRMRRGQFIVSYRRTVGTE